MEGVILCCGVKTGLSETNIHKEFNFDETVSRQVIQKAKSDIETSKKITHKLRIHSVQCTQSIHQKVSDCAT